MNSRKIRLLLGLTAFLAALIVQPGEPGSFDTDRRLQVTHWLWTSAPQVAPGEYPGFGIIGREGRLYAWYGLGQSLLMLPSDIAGTALSKAFPAVDSGEIRRLVVSYTVSPLICVLGILVCYTFLKRLNFPENQAILGSLALLFGTTFLHYTHNMMENNFILLLTLTGVLLHYEWVESGSRRALLAGALVLAANFLTRITTALDAMAVGVFVLLCLYFRGERGGVLARKAIVYAKTCAPFYLVAFAIDRLYHFYRFGECCSNYIAIYGRQLRQMQPSLPASYPYTTPFWKGFFGALITPDKSIFLFDPLLVLLVIVVLVMWKRLAAEIKAYVLAMSAILLVYIAFFARLAFWAGDVAWGDRYVATTVDLLAMLAVPLLLRYRPVSGKFLWRSGIAIAAISIVIQISSVLLWYPLEYRQMRTFHKQGEFVIGMRFANLRAWAGGNLDSWIPSGQPEIRTARSSTLYLYPFLVLRRGGRIPPWAGRVLLIGWFILIAALLWTLRALSSCMWPLAAGGRNSIYLVADSGGHAKL